MWCQKARKQRLIGQLQKDTEASLKGLSLAKDLGSMSMKMNNSVNHLMLIKSHEFIILKIQQRKEKWARQNSLNITVHFYDTNSLFWKLTVEKTWKHKHFILPFHYELYSEKPNFWCWKALLLKFCCEV